MRHIIHISISLGSSSIHCNSSYCNIWHIFHLNFFECKFIPYILPSDVLLFSWNCWHICRSMFFCLSNTQTSSRLRNYLFIALSDPPNSLVLQLAITITASLRHQYLHLNVPLSLAEFETQNLQTIIFMRESALLRAVNYFHTAWQDGRHGRSLNGRHLTFL